MSNAACKVIIDSLVRAGAEATALQVDTFPPDVIDSLIDLDLGYIGAMHLIQNGDGKTAALTAKFVADVSARQLAMAEARAAEFDEE